MSINLTRFIEAKLFQLGVGKDARERIDSLSSRLNAAQINALHYLRMERNKLTHPTNGELQKPFSNVALWVSRAKECLEVLQTASKPTIIINNIEATPSVCQNPKVVSSTPSVSKIVIWLLVLWFFGIITDALTDTAKPSPVTTPANQTFQTLKQSSPSTHLEKHKTSVHLKPQKTQKTISQATEKAGTLKPEVRYIRIDD